MRHAVTSLVFAALSAAVGAAPAAQTRAAPVKTPPPKAPFVLPPSAKVVERGAEGNGWLESGVMSVSFVSAEAQMTTALSRSGWSFVHRVPMPGRGNGVVCAYKKGSEELMLMLWRVDVGKTGYSWGIAGSGKSKGAKK